MSLDLSVGLSSAALLAALGALWKGGAWYGEYKEHRRTQAERERTHSAAISTYVTRTELELRELNIKTMLSQIAKSVEDVKEEVQAMRRESHPS